jgi:hypothetical protein
MESVSRTRTIRLPDLMDVSDMDHAENGPNVMIWPREGQLKPVLAKLHALSREHGHFDVHTKDTLPDRFHYHLGSGRISPILLLAHKVSLIPLSS